MKSSTIFLLVILLVTAYVNAAPSPFISISGGFDVGAPPMPVVPAVPGPIPRTPRTADSDADAEDVTKSGDNEVEKLEGQESLYFGYGYPYYYGLYPHGYPYYYPSVYVGK